MGTLRSMRRATRWVVLVMLGVLLAASVVSWVRSHSKLDAISYRWGTLRAPGEDPLDPDYWTYTSRSLSLNHLRGRVSVLLGRYKSIGPARADMSGWLSRDPWERASVPASMTMPGWEKWMYYRAPDDWCALGLGTTTLSGKGEAWRVVSVPHWLVTLVLAAGMTRLLVGSRATRRRRRGHCPKCGYDLRHALDAGCPECGWNRDASGQATRVAP